MLLKSLFLQPWDFDMFCHQNQLDYKILCHIATTRYLRSRENIPKAGNLHLAWHYAMDRENHGHFITMLRITPQSFCHLLRLIQGHPIFQNRSNKPQAPVKNQLAVTLYHMGRYGNGASVPDIARIAGISEGSVEKFTERCLIVILAHHDAYVRALTVEENEVEKKWVERESECLGWRDGYLMYDGTPIDLFQ